MNIKLIFEIHVKLQFNPLICFSYHVVPVQWQLSSRTLIGALVTTIYLLQYCISSNKLRSFHRLWTPPLFIVSRYSWDQCRETEKKTHLSRTVLNYRPWHQACAFSTNDNWQICRNRQSIHSAETAKMNTEFNGRVGYTAIPFSSKFIFWPQRFRHFSFYNFRFLVSFHFHSQKTVCLKIEINASFTDYRTPVR